MHTNENDPPTSRSVTWRELTADLVWPQLLRSVRLASRPSRLGVAFVVVVVMMGAGTLFDWVRGPVLTTDTLLPRIAIATDDAPTHGLFEATVATIAEKWTHVTTAVVSGDAVNAGLELRDLILTLPGELATKHTVSAGILTLIAITLWCIGGGTLCRMVAREIGSAERITSTQALTFVLPRWRRYLGALLGPVVAIALVVFAMALGGFVLLRLPALDIVGGALYGLFLFGGACIVFLSVGVALGGALLVPAVSVDAEDAFDAVQRAYAYVLAKPLRLLLYALTLALVGSIAFFIARAAVAATLDTTSDAAFAWTGGRESLALGSDALRATGEAPAIGDDVGASAKVSAELIRLWEHVAVALLAAFAVSFLASASTCLYLAMRKVCDGEDYADITPNRSIADR